VIGVATLLVVLLLALLVTRVATPSALVARVSGEIDLASALELEEHLCHADGKPILVDMSRVTFMNSSGLSALLRLRAEEWSRPVDGWVWSGYAAAS
jgi:anti-anti-sigma factor